MCLHDDLQAHVAASPSAHREEQGPSRGLSPRKGLRIPWSPCHRELQDPMEWQRGGQGWSRSVAVLQQAFMEDKEA